LPPLRDLGEGHLIRCHLAEDILQAMSPVIISADAAP